jgi:hypothetical protein
MGAVIMVIWVALAVAGVFVSEKEALELEDPLRLEDKLEPEEERICSTVSSSSSSSEPESDEERAYTVDSRVETGSTTMRCSTNELKLMWRRGLVVAPLLAESSDTW